MRRRSRLACCPLGAPACVICRASAIEALLASGRARMALQLARGLADDIREHVGQAMWHEYRRGCWAGRDHAERTRAVSRCGPDKVSR